MKFRSIQYVAPTLVAALIAFAATSANGGVNEFIVGQQVLSDTVATGSFVGDISSQEAGFGGGAGSHAGGRKGGGMVSSNAGA